MPRELRRAYLDALRQREGLILLAGPPGSGRRTTRNAGLRAAEEESRGFAARDHACGCPSGNAAPASDPAPSLLSAVVPVDIIDRATAEAVVEDSLAGTLFVARIDSGDALDAIGRLRSFGIDPVLLACSLRLIVAQRLARRLCRQCREPLEAAGSTGALLGFDPGTLLYEPRGCVECGGSGFSGRIGVFEAIRADPATRRLIGRGADESAIANHAFRTAPNLNAAARNLVSDGTLAAGDALALMREVAQVRRSYSYLIG